jgi:hypothetical protein
MRSIRSIAALLTVLLAPAVAMAGAPSVPRFVEETGTAGVASVYDGDWEYMVGGGAATFDCSGDGRPDLLLAGGTRPASLWRNASPTGGALRFEPVESGLELTAVTGTYPLDADADGKVDVLLLRVGENVIMRGLGACRFERANEAWGFDGGDGWSTAAAATFEAGTAWPTVAIGNYIDRTKGAMPWGSCTSNWLHRPRPGQRQFADPVALTPSYCALSMLFTDWARTGVPDLRISNDREYYKGGQEQLWRVHPGAEPSLYAEEEGWKRLRIWGMGIAGHDLDGDGYPEYYLTSMADNKLQRLAEIPANEPPRPTYADIALTKGATAHRPYTGGEIKPSTAWHAQFEDVNNDGRADLFVVKGNVAEMPDFALRDPNNLLLQDETGSFVEAGELAGVASFDVGRGGMLVDLNLDGLLDMVVVNRWKPAQIWRNAGPGDGRWVQLRLQQDGPNRDGIGSWIEVRARGKITRREITVGGGHASGHLGWWHMGVGAADAVDVRVLWPDGASGEWQRIESNRFYLLDRNAPPREWRP